MKETDHELLVDVVLDPDVQGQLLVGDPHPGQLERAVGLASCLTWKTKKHLVLHLRFLDMVTIVITLKVIHQ